MKETTEETGVVVNEALPTMEEAVPQLTAMDETIDQLENVNPTAGTKARKIWKRLQTTLRQHYSHTVLNVLQL